MEVSTTNLDGEGGAVGVDPYNAAGATYQLEAFKASSSIGPPSALVMRLDSIISATLEVSDRQEQRSSSLSENIPITASGTVARYAVMGAVTLQSTDSQHVR